MIYYSLPNEKIFVSLHTETECKIIALWQINGFGLLVWPNDE